MFTPLESIDDSRLIFYQQLRGPRHSKHDGKFVAEGALIVGRLLASDYEVQSVVVQRGREKSLELAPNSDFPVFVLERTLIQQLVGFDFHRGVLACGIRKERCTITELSHRPIPAISLGLFGISDQENLGSILRSAAAFGIDQVFLDPRCIDPFSRRVIRVSMGTVLKHRFVHLADTTSDLNYLREKHGYQIVAATLNDQAVDATKFRPNRQPIMLAVGNEAHGISDQDLANCDQQICIEMQLGTDSLNVAVAAAVLMHQIREAVRTLD